MVREKAAGMAAAIAAARVMNFMVESERVCEASRCEAKSKVVEGKMDRKESTRQPRRGICSEFELK